MLRYLSSTDVIEDDLLKGLGLFDKLVPIKIVTITHLATDMLYRLSDARDRLLHAVSATQADAQAHD